MHQASQRQERLLLRLSAHLLDGKTEAEAENGADKASSQPQHANFHSETSQPQLNTESELTFWGSAARAGAVGAEMDQKDSAGRRRSSVIETEAMQPSDCAGQWIMERTGSEKVWPDARLHRSCFSFSLLDDLDQSGSGRAWSPLSLSRLFYEGIGLMMLWLDAFATPFALAWSMPEVGIWMFWGWIVRLFWTGDVFLCFITGYWKSTSEVELRLSFVVRQYLRSSFILDFLIVLWDWASVFAPEYRVMRLGRAARLVRLIRQTHRLSKMAHVAKVALKLKKGTVLLIDMGAAMLVIAWLTHIFCCLWYSIGLDVEGSDTGITWLTAGSDLNLEDNDMYAYFTALHWSLTQMTPGSMEVTPKNSMERVYNVVVLFLGLVLCTSLISTITAMMTQYRIGLEAAHKNFRMLESYLDQVGVSSGLSRAIKVQVVARLGDAKNLKANEVSYLGLVSTSLREALWCHVCTSHFETHPFWSAWARTDPTSLLSFCNAAIDSCPFIQGDIVFDEQHEAKQMYIVASGELAYLPGPMAVEGLLCWTEDDLRLRKGMWCVELALWVKWNHAGTMHAAYTSDLLRVNMSRWQADSPTTCLGVAVLADYAKAYVKHLNHNLEGRSDLPHATNCGELMSDISHDLRLKMAQPILDHFAHGHANDAARMINPLMNLRLKRPKNLPELQNEVHSGKCDISITDRELVRSVFVVAMKIYRDNDLLGDALRPPAAGMVFCASLPLRGDSRDSFDSSRYLVNVAKLDGNGAVIKVGASIPGIKVSAKEKKEEALERMIHSDLNSIASILWWRHVNSRKEVNVFFKESPTYGIKTKYCRTTFSGYLDQSLDNFTVPVHGVRIQPDSEERNHFCYRRRRSEQESNDRSLHEAAEILSSIEEVVVIPSTDGNYDVYAWLMSSEFEVLTSGGFLAESMEQLLRRWAGEVNVGALWKVSKM